MNQPTAALGADGLDDHPGRPAPGRPGRDGPPRALAALGSYARPVRNGDGFVLTELDTSPHERPPMADVLEAGAALS